MHACGLQWGDLYGIRLICMHVDYSGGNLRIIMVRMYISFYPCTHLPPLL